MIPTTRTCWPSPTTFPQRDGGTHLAGLRGALTRQVTGYADRSGATKREKIDVIGDDCREGLTCVLSVKVPDPKFSSQTKDKLVSSEVRPVVESLVNDLLGQWFEEHPQEAKPVIAKVIENAQVREAGRKARESDPPQRACLTSPTCRGSSPTARSAIPPRPSCSWSRVTPPVAPPSRAATANIRPCFRCAVKS